MRRGEVWTISGGNTYAGKPRPAVIVRDDSFDATGSITICAFTTDPDRRAVVSPRRGAERAQRPALCLPSDDGQDHDRSRAEAGRAGRAAR